MDTNSTRDLVRLLIRASSEVNNGKTRTALLDWADSLLGEEQPESPTRSVSQGLTRPTDDRIAIYRRYKGKEYHGLIERSGRVTIDGKQFESPSSAAMSITSSNANGWRFWYYDDPIGKRLLIDSLRSNRWAT